MSEGIVYILTNEGVLGFVKVGKTSTSVVERINELDEGVHTCLGLGQGKPGYDT